MGMIESFLEYNEKFVAEKQYEKYQTSKYPDRNVAIVACMDTRLTELLPAALGIKNGDVKLIKNAGGVVMAPFGSVMRSLLVAVYELGVTEIMIIGHYDCGVQHMDGDLMLEHMRQRGIRQESIDFLDYCGFSVKKMADWFLLRAGGRAGKRGTGEGSSADSERYCGSRLYYGSDHR